MAICSISSTYHNPRHRPQETPRFQPHKIPYTAEPRPYRVPQYTYPGQARPSRAKDNLASPRFGYPLLC
ncbi:hypothetical protein BR93DRAFT_922565 [Coniochaeta sp. PMI_546]|nr:hypothetical protein BR93DRAFT_922565 [Coniochaeta sp. PMI_546]